MKRIFKSMGIVSVVAAFAVPSALAMHAPDEAGTFTRGTALSVKADTSDVFTRYVANHKITPIPYLSHGVGVDVSQYGGTGVADVASTRPDDRAGARVSEPSSIVSVASTSSGFDWADAGIGAGSAFGLILLMGLGVATTQRGRKGPLAA
jgi:hypothetical protein